MPRPAFAIRGRGEEAIDRALHDRRRLASGSQALGRRMWLGREVAEKLPHLIRRRRQAGEIEIDAPQPNLGRGLLLRLQTARLQAGIEQQVDRRLAALRGARRRRGFRRPGRPSAGADRAPALSSAGATAPAAIQALSFAISSAASGAPSGGMRSSLSVDATFSSSSAESFSMTSPDSPPLCISATASSRSPAFCLSAPWQA